jgi:hypothetical protein
MKTRQMTETTAILAMKAGLDEANARAAAPETHAALNRARQLLKKARDDAWLDQVIRDEIDQFLGDSQ